MGSEIKPIIIYGHESGPNPWKVVMVCEELNIPYDHKFLEFAKLHDKPFTDINPNGRVPAIKDPNNDDFILWESAAICSYLQEKYDKSNLLTPATANDKWLVRQWLDFQISGQGPYFGQAFWFKKYHPEILESAIQRYKDQTWRVFEVLEAHLKGKTYLVGEKYSVADLSFMMWNSARKLIFGNYKTGEGFDAAGFEKSFPNFVAWEKRVLERPAIKKTFEDYHEAISKMIPVPGREDKQ